MHRAYPYLQRADTNLRTERYAGGDWPDDYVLAVCDRDQPQDRTFAVALRYVQKSGHDMQYLIPQEL